MTLNVMPSFLKPLILTVAMLSSVATAHAISTSEAQSIWPYDEKVIAVRTESAVTADANTERMTAEFLIKQKRNACFAYPVLLKRPTGATAWAFEAADDGYQVSCSNHKRLREGTTLDAPESSPTTAGTAAGDKADETLNKAETNIDRVERAKSVADWLKNL